MKKLLFFALTCALFSFYGCEVNNGFDYTNCPVANKSYVRLNEDGSQTNDIISFDNKGRYQETLFGDETFYYTFLDNEINIYFDKKCTEELAMTYYKYDPTTKNMKGYGGKKYVPLDKFIWGKDMEAIKRE